MERLRGDGPHAAEMHAFARALNDVSLAQLDGPREPRQTSGWALLDPAGPGAMRDSPSHPTRTSDRDGVAGTGCRAPRPRGRRGHPRRLAGTVDRPRVRAPDGSGEVGLDVYRHFADRDPLSRVVLERMLASVSCRRYGRTSEPVGEDVAMADADATKPRALSAPVAGS
jgi:hypothetical protein